MRAAFLPFARPSLGDEEIAEVVDTLKSGWITVEAIRDVVAEFRR